MYWLLAGFFLILWLLGLLFDVLAGGWIHMLLAAAAVLLLMGVLSVRQRSDEGNAGGRHL